MLLFGLIAVMKKVPLYWSRDNSMLVLENVLCRMIVTFDEQCDV
jgi:hypothetical protein